jgi:glycolate oxidase FAD binding subunit
VTWPEPPGAGPLGDGRFASAADRPETLDALREAVVRRVADGLAIYPQGGRTALDYGGIPRRPGAAIDTRALGRVVDYPAADMTVTVEAGITLAALQSTLAEQGQRLPLDAPSPDRATLGGIFATNTSGPRRFGCGRPRDLIIGVGVVTGEGKLIKGGGRVVKNVAGYDLPKLLTGSMGTLGIIAQLTLKVRPRPEAAAIVLASYDGADALDAALTQLNTSGTRPVALEVLNRPARGLVVPGDGPGPEWTLAVGFEANAAAVAWQVDRLKEELRPREAIVHEGAEAVPTWSALAEFPAREVGPLAFVANVRPSTVAPLLRSLDPARWAAQAHAGNGIVRAHALGDWTLEESAVAIDRLRAAAVRDGGNLVLSRCPTDWKERLRVWGEPRADWALGEKVKRALDPGGVMNPGRFVGTI